MIPSQETKIPRVLWCNQKKKKNKSNLMRRLFCCSIALPRTPAPHSQTMREFLQSWETVSLQRQRLPAVSDPGVPEFFLLSNRNLPSCNFHPLFPVTCLRPEKKQALFFTVTALRSQRGGGEGLWADRVMSSLTLSLFFCEMLIIRPDLQSGWEDLRKYV